MPVTQLDKPAPETDCAGSYEHDFYSWTLAQAAALRAGTLSDLDLANLAEEIEDLGRQEFNQLAGAYRVILVHMLKWDHQPQRRSRSWVTSIKTQRLDLENILKDNPSLQGRVTEAVARAYRKARINAAGESRLPEKVFPTACPYTLDEILKRPFDWPES
jgi:hypothetical protein